MVQSITYSDRGDVREIRSDTGGVDDIVEGEFIDERASLQQKRERLANATRGTKNSCSMASKPTAVSSCRGGVTHLL